jgi:O-antigen/teichoic acid export membrane protein
VVTLLANTLYFLILTNVLKSTLNVGVITALNITIWLLVTICIIAQPITLQSPIPAPLAVLKFLPELNAKKDYASAARIFRTSLGGTGILGAVVAVILLAAPNLVVPLIGGEAIQLDLVRLAGIDVLVLSLGQLAIGTLIALGDMKRASVFIISWSFARYAVASVLLLMFSLTGVLVGWVIGDSFLLCIALWASSREVRRGTGSGLFRLTDLAKYSVYTLFGALIGYAVNQADKVFTLANQGLRELAVYNVAIVAATFTGFAPYALLTVLLPALSALHSMRSDREMHEMMRAYTRYVSIVVLPIAMGFAAITQVALRIFGPEYLGGLMPSMIVSVATGLTAIGVVYAAYLLATEQLVWYTAANVLGLVGLFGVSAVASEFLGLSGPALGRATLMAVTALIYALAVRRKGFLHLDAKAFFGATVSAALMGIVVFAAQTFVSSFLLKLALLPLLVILGAGIYLVGLRILHLLTREDLEFARGLVPERFHSLILKIGEMLGIDSTR